MYTYTYICIYMYSWGGRIQVGGGFVVLGRCNSNGRRWWPFGSSRPRTPPSSPPPQALIPHTPNAFGIIFGRLAPPSRIPPPPLVYQGSGVGV